MVCGGGWRAGKEGLGVGSPPRPAERTSYVGEWREADLLCRRTAEIVGGNVNGSRGLGRKCTGQP